jgi:oxygen-independent coproporphyrinogen III oxidase
MMNDPHNGGDRTGSDPGLYIHVPFCKTKCPYCDFYSIPAGESIGRWLEALAREATLRRGACGAFDTLYIGGGTPSVLSDAETERIFEIVDANFRFVADSEVTIEANPDDVTPRAAALWHELGVNRVSLGAQSFDDGALRFLGRRHDAARAREALRLLRDAGFSNIGIDLIYGFEGQSLDSWLRTLAEAIDHHPEHLSCYQMTIARSTEFGAMLAAGRLAALDEEAQRAFFLETSAALTRAGYVHYEVSNFARNKRLRSRHNGKYWIRAPYIGLGPSAHSFTDGKRWWNVRSVETYCRLLEEQASPVEDSEALGEEETALETVALGFRTRDGVPLEALRGRPGWERALETLVAEGLLSITDGRAAPTTEGLCVADRLAIAFAG